MSGQAIRIRNWGAGDLDTLYRIDQACFSEEIAYSRTELTFYLEHPQSIARVAEEGGRIIGFVLARAESPSIAHIITLDIVPEARRRRIGTSLMEELHSILRERGVEAAVLEVSTQNAAAQQLYEKMNYQYLETLSGYYKGQEDAYRMFCLLVGGVEGKRGKGLKE